MNRGIAYALFSYIFWGILPIYWKLMDKAPAQEILSHRIFWAFVFFAFIISFRKGWKNLLTKITASKKKWIIFFPPIIIGLNWFIYIWAVISGYIIETSLGYFISPLFSVFLGVIFLKESLRRFQWIAVATAGIGVLIMTVFYGQFPWIAVILASTWSVYGLLRKKSPLDSVEGLTLEAGLLSFAALIYLIFAAVRGYGLFGHDLNITLLFIGSGIISGIPLLVFITAARLINLSLIGILQYIYPTIIFLIGFFIYDETLTEAKLIGFIFVWIALFVYSIGGTYSFRRKKIAEVIE